MFMSGTARTRDAIARESPALSRVCTAIAERWVAGGANPGTCRVVSYVYSVSTLARAGAQSDDTARLGAVVSAGGGQSGDGALELVAASGGGDECVEMLGCT
jgi:hypothetical protein